MKKTSDLILHPVRMRIIQSLLGDKQLTVQDMLVQLADVPQATLYRHLNKLVEARIIQVIASRQVRGSYEKIYALKSEDATFSTDAGIGSAKEEQMRVFMQKIGGLMDYYGKSLNDINENKNVCFETLDLYMNEEELKRFIEEVNEVVDKYRFTETRADRQKVKLATIIIPTQK